MPCQFCGSEEIRIKSELIELKRDGEYGPITNWCCSAQKQNQDYKKKHSDESTGEHPSDEEIATW